MTAYHDRLNAGTYSSPPSAEDLEQQTVTDLKAELTARNLPTSGTKTELIERLANTDTDA
jgi:hypothetical protein